MKWPSESEVEAVSESARRGDSNTIFLRLADVHCRLVRDTDASSTGAETSSTGAETVDYKMHSHLYITSYYNYL